MEELILSAKNYIIRIFTDARGQLAGLLDSMFGGNEEKLEEMYRLLKTRGVFPDSSDRKSLIGRV